MGDSVEALLAQSHRAHLQARTARRAGRVDDHFSAIADAQRLRLDAHALDPAHFDQAWLAEQSQGFYHDALLLFYASEFQKDQAQERVLAKDRLEKGLAEVAATTRIQA